MNKLTLACALTLPMNVIAQISSTATLTSDYVWRGLTQNSHESAVQGSMNYEHKSGAYLGVWATSLGGEALGQEVDTVIGYNYKIDDTHSIGISYTDYTYTRSLSSNFQEIGLNYSGKWFDFLYTLSENYGGDDDNGKASYTSLSKSLSFGQTNVGLNLSLGLTTIDDDKKWSGGYSSYSDYRIGVTKSKGDFTAELFHSSTNGRENSSGDKFSEDSVVGFSLSTTL